MLIVLQAVGLDQYAAGGLVGAPSSVPPPAPSASPHTSHPHTPHLPPPPPYLPHTTPITPPLAPSDLAAILAVDWLLDRCRTAVNLLSDGFGCVVVDSAMKARHPHHLHPGTPAAAGAKEVPYFALGAPHAGGRGGGGGSGGGGMQRELSEQP